MLMPAPAGKRLDLSKHSELPHYACRWVKPRIPIGRGEQRLGMPAPQTNRCSLALGNALKARLVEDAIAKSVDALLETV